MYLVATTASPGFLTSSYQASLTVTKYMLIERFTGSRTWLHLFVIQIGALVGFNAFTGHCKQTEKEGKYYSLETIPFQYPGLKILHLGD